MIYSVHRYRVTIRATISTVSSNESAFVKVRSSLFLATFDLWAKRSKSCESYPLVRVSARAWNSMLPQGSPKLFSTRLVGENMHAMRKVSGDRIGINVAPGMGRSSPHHISRTGCPWKDCPFYPSSAARPARWLTRYSWTPDLGTFRMRVNLLLRGTLAYHN